MKYCTNCGKENEDQVKFCASCGKEFEENAAEGAVVAAPAKPTKKSGMAIAGFVLSLVGVLIIPMLFGILGCIFSGVGLAKTVKGALKGKGLAIAGLIISLVDIVYAIIVML